MLVCTMAMVYAAVIEGWRLDLYRSTSSGVGASPERVPLNILWQSPAYILVGASEVLASVGQLEFFYDQVRAVAALGAHWRRTRAGRP